MNKKRQQERELLPEVARRKLESIMQTMPSIARCSAVFSPNHFACDPAGSLHVAVRDRTCIVEELKQAW
jgi:hypothetical protein